MYVTVIVGDYVMVEPISEGDKVKAEISHILYKPQVQFIHQQGLWWVAQFFSVISCMQGHAFRIKQAGHFLKFLSWWKTARRKLW